MDAESSIENMTAIIQHGKTNEPLILEDSEFSGELIPTSLSGAQIESIKHFSQSNIEQNREPLLVPPVHLQSAKPVLTPAEVEAAGVKTFQHKIAEMTAANIKTSDMTADQAKTADMEADIERPAEMIKRLEKGATELKIPQEIQDLLDQNSRESSREGFTLMSDIDESEQQQKDLMIRLSALDNVLNHPEVARLNPTEVEAALKGHEFLREILGMLKQDIQSKKADLLKRNIEQKMKIEESKKLQEESVKLTNLGIGLHKQGQIIDRVRAEQRLIRKKLEQESRSVDLPPRERNQKIQKLLQRRNQLQQMMNRLIEAVIAEQKYNTIRQVLSNQERILNSSLESSSIESISK